MQCICVRAKKGPPPALKQAGVNVDPAATGGKNYDDRVGIGAHESGGLPASLKGEDSDDNSDQDEVMELKEAELKSKTAKQRTPEEDAVSFPRRFSSAEELRGADEELESPTFYSRRISARAQQETERAASFRLDHTQLSLPQSPMRGRKRTTSGARLSRQRSSSSMENVLGATSLPSSPEDAPSVVAYTTPPATAPPAETGVT